MLDAAVDTLRSGGLLAFPTETVWGIGCDADNDEAIARLYAAKRRERTQPLTLHLGPQADPAEWGRFDKGARALADAFWPGPLTLVVPKTARSSDALTAGLRTIGIRIPSHQGAMTLLDGLPGGVAASSANRRGEPPCLTVQEIRARLLGDIDAIFDHAPACEGLSSTVLSLAASPRILRSGTLSREALQDVLGELIQ